MLSLALTDMTNGQLQPTEGHSKGFFKDKRKRFEKLFSGSSSWSTSPQPSASRQGDWSGELPLVRHPIVSSGHQWIGDPVIGASAALSQQGIFHVSCALDKALSPACRLSHTSPVIKITAVLLKVRPIWICSGPRFETLKAYGTC